MGKICCSDSCKSCSTGDKCEECTDSTFWHREGSTDICVKVADCSGNGKWYFEPDNECKDCSRNCWECENEGANCLKCQDTYRLYGSEGARTCINAECPKG